MLGVFGLKRSRNGVHSTLLERRAPRTTDLRAISPSGFEASSSISIAGAQELLDGFVNGGGLLAVPIIGAVFIVTAIGGLLVWSSKPAVRDDDE